MTVRINPRDNLTRAVTTLLVGNHEKSRNFEKLSERLFPDDRVTPILVRAATSPASIGNSTWGEILAGTAVADLVQNLGPTNAGAQVLKRGLSLSFGPAGTISVPTLLAVAADDPFFAEAAPLVVRQDALSAVSLTPKKLGAIVCFSREIFTYGIEAMTAIVSDHLRQSVGAAIDLVLFDTNAATTVRPAGLRSTISAESATAGGGQAAMFTDIGKLVAKVAGISQGNVGIVASPDAASKILLYTGGVFPYPVWSTNGLATGTAMAVALSSVASVIDPTPRITISEAAVLHLEDTSPAQISSTTTAVAAPLRSLFQSDTLAVRLVMQMNWAIRSTAANCVDWVTSITW